jgi:uncharacterized protein (DUF952 family)
LEKSVRQPANSNLRGVALILHLTPHADWLAAQPSGLYRTPSLQKEGFIHCSTAQQIVRVADSFYSGQHGLVLLVIDPERLSPELRWEPPSHPNPQKDLPPSDELFPHIYGPLNIDAVVKVLDFEPDVEGKFSQPILE